MENKEYVIIDKIAIQKRIEELVFDIEFDEKEYVKNLREKKVLKQILSQSIPLIPEIENAFTKGERYGWDSQKSIGNIDEMREKIKIQSLEQYISNLKLEI